MSLRNGSRSARHKAAKGKNRQALERACRGALAPAGKGFEALEDRKLFAIVAPVIQYNFDDQVGAVSSTRPQITDSAPLDGQQNAIMTGSVPADAAKIVAGGPKASSTGYLDLNANTNAQNTSQDQGRLDIADINKYLRGTGSLALWLRTTTKSNANDFWNDPSIAGVEEGGAGDDVFWGHINEQGQIGIGKDQDGAMTPFAINDGQWRHFVFTRASGNGMVRVYVNGLLAAELDGNDGVVGTPFRSIGATEVRQSGSNADKDITAVPHDPNNAGIGINIGDPADSVPQEGLNGRTYFDGDMDEVQIWNVELTPTDVVDMFAAKGPVEVVTGAEAVPHLYGITVRWNPQPNALQYRIFKADWPLDTPPPMDEFGAQNPSGPYAVVPNTLSGKVEFKDGGTDINPDGTPGNIPLRGSGVSGNGDEGLAPGMRRYYRIVPVNALNQTTTPSGQDASAVVGATTGTPSQTAGASGFYFTTGFWGRTGRNTDFDVQERAYVPEQVNFIPVKPQFSETVPRVDFDWGTGTPVLGTKNVVIGGDNHSTVFTGKLKAPFTGDYTILGYGDDDTYLYVNGKLASFDPLGHGIRDPRTSTTGGGAFPLTLTQGQEVNFVVYQAEQGGGSGVRLEWRRPNANNSTAATQERIPASAYTGNLPNAAGGEADGRPLAPTNLALSQNDIGASRYVLTWNDNATNEMRYVLERAINDASFSFPSEVELPTNRDFYADTGRNPGITYHYRIRADNLFGESSYSNTLAVLPNNKNGTTEPNERPAVDLPPAAPSDVRVWNRDEGVYISFQDNSLVEYDRSNPGNGFEIDRIDLSQPGAKWISITGDREVYLDDEDPNGSIQAFPDASTAQEIYFGSPGARRIRLLDQTAIDGRRYLYRVRSKTVNFTGGDFRLRSAFSAPSNTVTAGPVGGQGWRATYFDNIDFTGTRVEVPASTHVDSDQNFGNASPVGGIGADNLSGILEGEFLAQTTEEYTFVVATDDGVAFRLIDPTIQPAETDDPATPQDERNAHVLIDFDNLGIGRGLPGAANPPIFQDLAGRANLVRDRKYIIQFRWNEGGGGAGYKIGYVANILTNGQPEVINNVAGQAEMIFRASEGTPQVPASRVTAFENLRNEQFAVQFNDTNTSETGYRLMRSLDGVTFVEATRSGPVFTGGSFGTANRTFPVTLVDDLGTAPEDQKPAFGSTIFYKVETLGNSARTQFATSNTVSFTPQDTNSPVIQVNNNATVLNRQNPNTNTVDDDLRLTDNANDQRGSGYMTDGRDFIQPGKGLVFDAQNNPVIDPTTGQQQTTDGFNLEFDFQVRDQTGTNGQDPADGFAFVMQRTSKFSTGSGGGGLGYQGVGKSVAVKFDTWPGGTGRNQTGLYRNGEAVNDNGPATGLPFATDDRRYTVKLSYNHTAKTLTQSITDKLDPTKVFRTTYTNVDLKQIMGGESAWIGFTGATGGLNAEQHILGFHFNGERIFGQPNAGPKVDGVFVRGSNWNQAFRDHLASVNQGSAVHGYRVADGTAASDELPWTNLNQVTVTFDNPVNVDAADVRLRTRSTSGASYTVGAANVAVAADGRSVTITLDPSNAAVVFGADRVELLLSGQATGVTGRTDGAALDGNNDGQAGGDFAFRFNTLPGDVDRNGAVNIFDTLATRNRQGTSTTSPGTAPNTYTPFHDVDGNGAVNIFDTLAVRNRQGTSLPAEGPAPTFAAVFSSTSIFEEAEEEEESILA